MRQDEDDKRLISSLQRREAAQRKAAAQEIGERRIEELAPQVARLLHDSNAGVVATAAWALGRLRYGPAESTLIDLLGAPGVSVRQSAARALGQLGTSSALDALLSALPDADEALAQSILAALDDIPADILMPRLVALLHDPRGQARSRAARVLLRYPDAARTAVAAALEESSRDADDSQDVRFRRSTAYVLGETATRAVLDALLRLSHSEDPRTRLYAARGLGKLAPTVDEARARLQELAGDSRRDVAAVAREALESTMASSAGERDQETPATPLPLDLEPELTYLLTVLPGLEEIAAEEIGRMPEACVVRQLHGGLLITLGTAPAILSRARTILDALLFVGYLPDEPATSTDFGPIGEDTVKAVLRACPDLPPTVYISIPRGTPPAQAAAWRAAATEGLARCGLRVDPARATVTADVVPLGEETLLGIRALADAPGHRPLPAGGVPASLNATLAAAMILLTGPDPADRFLDPLCGAGTLLRERALAGPYEALIGGDRDGRALALARRNLQGVSSLTLRRWDATALPLPDSSIDKAAVNPPYGLRAGSHETNRHLYPALLGELARVVRPEGRVALVTAEQRLMVETLRAGRAFAREKELTVETGGLRVGLYLLRRRPQRGSA